MSMWKRASLLNHVLTHALQNLEENAEEMTRLYSRNGDTHLPDPIVQILPKHTGLINGWQDRYIGDGEIGERGVWVGNEVGVPVVGPLESFRRRDGGFDGEEGGSARGSAGRTGGYAARRGHGSAHNGFAQIQGRSSSVRPLARPPPGSFSRPSTTRSAGRTSVHTSGQTHTHPANPSARPPTDTPSRASARRPVGSSADTSTPLPTGNFFRPPASPIDPFTNTSLGRTAVGPMILSSGSSSSSSYVSSSADVPANTSAANESANPFSNPPAGLPAGGQRVGGLTQRVEDLENTIESQRRMIVGLERRLVVLEKACLKNEYARGEGEDEG